MFQKILIANRGEIAVRVIRACRELGCQAIAVYTDPDREALHAQLADEAYLIPDYLDVPALLETARRAGADAVHPGYGFLSENAGFAGECLTSGLAWIGPEPEAIAAMGSKTASRRIAQAAGVPIVPGTTDPVTRAEEVQAFGARHGYPLAIKAAAGGGGRGLVVVRSPEDAEEALGKAIREGETYFKSGEVYLERYLAHPRHIEVQVLCDRHGAATHLGERECSIQRRHQKLVEEAPSPALTPELREAMGASAVTLARAVGYDSAGTVEFLFENGSFYFLEMNTRIQVEHTVTELVWGVDLVKEQIRIAAGDPLRSYGPPRGWALECRINAEDPAVGFRPCPGLVTGYREPAGPGIRVDAAAYPGWRVPQQYDSLLAKLVSWGEDRQEAIARMERALAEYRIEGVPTTLGAHVAILAHPAFREGRLSTRFLEEDLPPAALKAACAEVPVASAPEAVPPRRVTMEVNGKRFEVAVFGEVAPLPATRGAAPPSRPGSRPRATSNGNAARAGNGGPGEVVAPMHAVVRRVLVELGAVVAEGQPLLVLEAMKMESELAAPVAGVVAELAAVVGQTVEGGALLALVKP